KHSRATPSQPSRLSPANPAAARASLHRAEQTFQQAKEVQGSRPWPNRHWSRHGSNKRGDTRQDPAFGQFSIQWIAACYGLVVGVDIIGIRYVSRQRWDNWIQKPL